MLLIKRRQTVQHLLPMLWVDEPNMSNKTYHILHYKDGFVKRHSIPCLQFTDQKYIMHENALELMQTFSALNLFIIKS